jgi:hypothetical protein
MNTTHSFRTMERLALPSELSGAVPRDVRLTGGGIALAVVALAMAIGALVTAISMSVAYTRAEGQRQLREREGKAADAEIVHVTVTRGEHPRRSVTYRYGVNGRTYTGRTTLPQRDPRDMAQGGRIPIGYVSSHPEMSWTVGYEPESFPLWVIPLASISLLAAAAAIAWRVRRQWVLLSEGRVTQARVTAFKKVGKDRRHVYRVSYEFQTLSGARHTGRHEAAKTPPPVGTLLPIVYHRDTPQWSAAYPLQLVTPARARRRVF